MKYFNSLPSISLQGNDGLYSLKNLLIRTQMIPQLSRNPLLFYQYTIQEGDTPEIVASKYYNDPYRYWIVLYGNPEKLNPQSDWPLTSKQFDNYIIDKYSEAAGGANNAISYATSTVYHYEKIITTTDSLTSTKAVKVIVVDENTYNDIVPTSDKFIFPNGTSVTYEVTKKEVSIYDYENNQNEAKRNISLINASYADQMETQYQTLVRA